MAAAVASTSATTMPSSRSPTAVDLLDRPGRGRQRVADQRAGSPSIDRSDDSLSQDSRTFISELLQEADVVGEQVAEVVDAVAFLGHAVDAEAEGEAAPLLGVEPAGAQHVRVHHAAAAELEPGAVGALDVELGGRLGEREVARAQPRREAGAEERLRERLDRAGQVGRT